MQPAQGAEVTLEVLNPKGNVELVKLQPLAERVDTLAGKKVGFYFYSKDNSSNSLNVYGAIRYYLAEMFPTAIMGTSTTKSGVAYHDTLANYETLAKNSDVVVLGVAN